VTTLHITHNRAEAIRLADVVLLLENGTIRSVSRDELRELGSVAQKCSRHGPDHPQEAGG
jgi:ABC-type sulfate/molybdate transport systems ATPase subunit